MASSSSPASSTENKDASNTKVTVAEVEKPASVSRETESAPKIGGALPDLLYGAFLPCLPVVIVSAVLLTLIFRHRVRLDPGWQLLQAPTTDNVYDPNTLSQILSLKTTGGSDAYYVRYNPAVLAAIASWTGKIIPFITSSLMAVVAFFAGRRILEATKSNSPNQLPTPHQMSILINLLRGADVSPLRETIMYRWQHHEHLVQPLPMAFGALSFIVFLTFLIGAADTWFATSTQPMNVALLGRHLTPLDTYGRDLDPNLCASTSLEQRPCPSNSTSLCGYPCSIENWNYTVNGATWMKQGIKGAQQSAQSLLSNSEVNLIYNYTYQSGQQDSVPQQYFYLGDLQTGEYLDFLANTTAVTTQCGVMTQNCQINSTSQGFSCPGYQSPSFTYTGAVGVDPSSAMASSNMSMVGIQFFTDADHQSPIGLGNHTTQLFGAQNPIHFLTWSKGFPPIDTSSQAFNEMRNGKYLQLDLSGDNVFILNCTSTIYKITYAWVNGTVLQGQQSNGFYPELAPDAYGAIFSAPFAIDSSLGHLALQSAAALAAYKTSPQDVADKFSDEFSRAAVALTAGIMSPTLNMLEQSRNNTELLTRVPKIPLYFLVGLQAFYALASILLALLAWILTGPSEAQEVKSRLTIDGLAAGLFEPGANQEKAVEKIEHLYGEHSTEEKGDEANKVGIKQTEAGGWVWVASGLAQKAWTNLGVGGVLETVVDSAADRGELGTAGTDFETLKKIM